MTYTPHTVWIGGAPCPPQPKPAKKVATGPTWRKANPRMQARNALILHLRQSGIRFTEIAPQVGISASRCAEIVGDMRAAA